MNYHPEFNDKVELMFAMAPVTTLAHTRAILRYVIPIQRLVQVFMKPEFPFTFLNNHIHIYGLYF